VQAHGLDVAEVGLFDVEGVSVGSSGGAENALLHP